MEIAAKRWKVQNKSGLLLALMEKLAGDAHVSFEGNLKGLKLLSMPDASEEPTPSLKRNTLWPKQDFVIVPLEPPMTEGILAAIGGTIPRSIIHIQIEKRGVLQFGAYDHFQPECIYFGGAVEQAFIDWLISEGIMRAYTDRQPGRIRTS